MEAVTVTVAKPGVAEHTHVNASIAAAVEKYNGTAPSSTNTTIPWDNQEAMQERFQQWMRLENLPAFSSIAFGLATFVLFISSAALRYTLWQVVATLAIVEAPQAIFRNDRSRSEEKRSDDEHDAALITHERPTTASVRTALRHLYRVGGPTAFFRGTALAWCSVMISIWPFGATGWLLLKTLPETRITSFLVDFLAKTTTAILLSQLDTAHVHILITQPTLRVWYRRLPPFRATVKSTWLPQLVKIIASEATDRLPHIINRACGLYSTKSYLGSEAIGTPKMLRMALFTLIWLAAFAVRIGFLVPAGVALVRVQASLLPDDEDTIVPVDRTFSGNAGKQGDGYAPPGILAPPHGAITFRAAWKSFDWLERRRILLLYAKFVLIEGATRLVFWPVLGTDAWPNRWNP